MDPKPNYTEAFSLFVLPLVQEFLQPTIYLIVVLFTISPGNVLKLNSQVQQFVGSLHNVCHTSSSVQRTNFKRGQLFDVTVFCDIFPFFSWLPKWVWPLSASLGFPLLRQPTQEYMLSGQLTGWGYFFHTSSDWFSHLLPWKG